MTMSDRIAVMKDGVIEQLGTPMDIYDHPRTRFVADFIGESNVFEGKVITPPRTNYILDGITRGVVLELCRAQGIPAREDVLPASKIACADELMIAGTTVEITPVLRIINGTFRSHEPGPVTRRLQKAFRARADAGHD